MKTTRTSAIIMGPPSHICNRGMECRDPECVSGQANLRMVPEPPPRPLSRGQVRGLQIPFIGVQYPRWMFDLHYVMDDIAVSNDGKQHWPKKPTPTQMWKIEEAQRVIAYYDGLKTCR